MGRFLERRWTSAVIAVVFSAGCQFHGPSWSIGERAATGFLSAGLSSATGDRADATTDGIGTSRMRQTQHASGPDDVRPPTDTVVIDSTFAGPMSGPAGVIVPPVAPEIVPPPMPTAAEGFVTPAPDAPPMSVEADAMLDEGESLSTLIRSPQSVRSAPPLASDRPSIGTDPSPMRVREAFFETDLRDALRSLCDQAELSLVVGEEVGGSVSAVIEDEPVDAAVRRVLILLGYTHRIIDATCYVGLPDPESTLFPYLSVEYVYTARHREPADLLDALPLRERDYVRPEGAGGRLVVEAPAEIADRILTRLERLDRSVDQVMLEVLVCVYSPETDVRFGFDFQQGVTIANRRGGALSFDSLGIGAQYAGTGIQSQLNDFRIASAFLRALEQKGHVRIHAAPHVLAQDGKKAEIQIGRETFFSPRGVGNGLLLRQDIQRVQSGVLLELTPTICPPRVTIDIERAEVSEDLRMDETRIGAADQFPVINRRRVGTTVTVPDGNTVVIGGLRQQQEFDQVNKVPVLGDIRFLGKLFRRTERREQETELAIFISPRVVSDCWFDAPPSIAATPPPGLVAR